MNIIYGGSFNPVTIGHFKIYEYIKSHFKYDKFIILPTPISYLNGGFRQDLIDNESRYEMLKIAFSNTDSIIDRTEIDKDEYSGTYNYLKNLKLDDVYFVLGADNLKDIKRWINYKKLISEYKFIVFNRDNLDLESIIDSDIELKKYKDNFILIKDFNINLSASLFRNTKDKKLVDPKVYDYIKNKGLYGV